MVALQIANREIQVTTMTTKRFDDRFAKKVPTIHGNEGEDFRLRELRVEAVLRGKDIVEALVEEEVGKRTSERALVAIVSALGYNPLRTIQDCKTAVEAREMLVLILEQIGDKQTNGVEQPAQYGAGR